MVDRGEVVPNSEAMSLGDALTAQFYAWERRGRGWDVLPHPVELEPPFVPFVFHAPPSVTRTDDARKPTFWSSLIESLVARLKPRDATFATHLTGLEMEDPEPIPAAPPSEICEFRVVPGEAEFARQEAEHFLLNLSVCDFPVAFELIGTSDAIVVQLCGAAVDRAALRSAISAYFPDAIVSDHATSLRSLWERHLAAGVVIDFGLSHEFMRPLAAPRRSDHDPLLPFVTALGSLNDDEVAVFQTLFQRARYPWAESCLRAVSDGTGHAFFADAPEMVGLTERKVGRPLFGCAIRIGVHASPPRAWQVAKQLVAGFAQFADPLSNELVPLENAEYADEDHVADLLSRCSRRSGLLLNSEELAALVHVPAGSINAPKLRRDVAKAKAAPATVTGRPFILGENLHQGRITRVSLDAPQRLQHTYIIGASGTGKSTLLLNLIVQDLEQGSGFAVLDPHGDLVEEVLARVPDDRAKDVIVFDPADETHPVALNIFSAHSEIEKNLLSSDLVAVFRRLSTSWGDQMTSVLGNAVLAFLESSRGGTIADLRRFLVEPEFRREFLSTVVDPGVCYFWEKEFPLLSGRPQAPLLTRLDAFLRPKIIRQMVSQKDSRIDFGEIMNGGKVFLGKLSQGLIGEENAYLLGSFLVSKFHQIAMSRQELGRENRRPFYLYIDEFHHFITPSMAAILSGARKYGMGLVLAHQDLRQLLERDLAVANSVISNPFTRVCFRLGDFDAKKLADGFASFEAKDLQNLSVGEAVCRIERAEYDFNVHTLPTTVPSAELASARKERVLALSRSRYGCGFVPTDAPTARNEEYVRPPMPATKTATRPREPVRQAPRPRVSSPERKEVSSPGRGGAQHKYLQELVKRLAEARGFRSTVERSVLDGMGSVDVALERAALRIACEICVTSTEQYELQNAHKCLAAGFDRVVIIAADQRAMNRLKELEREFEKDERVLVLLPNDFVRFLDDADAKAANRENTVRGYKVKVKFKAVSEEDQKSKKQAVSRVILDTLKRLKG